MSSPDAERFALAALDRFYRWQAPLYDWTRPFFLFGRGRMVDGLDVGPGHLVLDVGCGTGWSFPRLLRRSARVVGIEVSEPMRRRALALGGATVDSRPYGTHAGYVAAVTKAADNAFKLGYLLATDRDALVTQARNSDVLCQSLPS